MSYCIIRFHRDVNHPDHHKVIKTDLTFEEAKAHCKDPENREAGVWFDGFEEE